MKMKKRAKGVLVFLSILAMALCMQLTVYAASSGNPLKNMPTKSATIVSAVAGTGCNFFTPEYKSNFKMTATSSNKKVATVKVYNFRSENNGYYKGYEVTRKGYGTTNIKVTVTIGKKTYTKTCKYTYYKYSNPFSTFKIGNASYVKKLSKSELKLPASKLKGKLSYKLKKGYKVNRITCFYGKTYKSKTLKNNATLPSNIQYFYINMQNTKTKAYFNVKISVK